MIISLDKNNFNNFKKDLTELLIDSVNSGASVGFLPPLLVNDAVKYWDGVETEIDSGIKDLLIILNDNNKMAGSVQLLYSDKPNASHRAEVMKLFVHTSYRKLGFGKMLMNAAEEKAKERGRTLLVLDTRKGDPSENLYLRMGYIKAGEIPFYAKSANGELHTTVIFYKYF